MNSRINKINRPLLTDIVPRERLFRLLDGALKRPVVWVHGPGGSGKSSLVASYIDCRTLPCLWYQVDRGDQDVATLFYYLGMALENAGFSTEGPPLPLLTPGQHPELELFAKRYFERLFAALPSSCVLVFDDCHEVADDSPFHQVLRSGLYEIPDGIHVIVVSRNAVPSSLIHLRSRSMLNTISWSALRLTPAETEAIIRARRADHVAREDARRLHERIQGWVAGLVLVLEGGHASISTAVPEMQPVKEVFDYFAAELFTAMNEATQSFLLKTAVFSEVAPLPAQRLTQQPDAGRILSGLYEKNCFTERRYEGGSMYRYHPLFREFLLERACQFFSPDEMRGIRHAAAIALEESGRQEEATELFMAAESWQDAARLIIRIAPAYLAQGRGNTMQQWLERLPEELAERHPYLPFWQGACRLPEAPISAFSDFKRAYQIFQEHDDRVGMCLSWAAGANATLYSDSIYHEWIPEMESYMRQHHAFPSPEIEARVITSMFNAMSFQQPDHLRIRELEEQSYGYFWQEHCLDSDARLKTGVYLAVFNLWCGEIPRARLIADRLDLISRTASVSDLTSFTIKTTQALVDFFTASFGACRQRVFEALQLAEETGIRALYLHVMGHGLAAALSDGDLDTVDTLLARMRDNLDRAGELDQAYYYFSLAWRARLEGDLEGAFHNLAITSPFMGSVDNLPSHAIAHIALAELYCRRGDGEAAQGHVALARRFGERLRSHVVEFMCLLLEADLNLEQGRAGEGIVRLRTALALGRSHGIVNMYWWQPDTMVRLCMRALREGIEAGYVSALIRLRGLVPRNPPLDMEEWPWPVKVYTLGRFELHANGNPVLFSGKVQKKPLEMLKVLLALEGEESREGQIADLLWPEAEGDTARKSLKSTLHRLRYLLGNEKAVLMREGRLILNRCQVWTDVLAFEELLAKARVKMDATDETEAIRLTEKALALYRGHFLDQGSDIRCIIALRNRLQGRFRTAILSLGNLWRDRGDQDRAMECYHRGVEVDDLAEELYRNLMSCYLSAGLRGELLTTFRNCGDALALHGLSPSRETVALYRQALL
jgi:DNA-binding SARP family transcriptional activator